MFSRLPGGICASLCWSSSLVSTEMKWVSGRNWLSQLGSHAARAAMRSTIREPVPPIPRNIVGMIVPCPLLYSSAMEVSLLVSQLEKEGSGIVAIDHVGAHRRLRGVERLPGAIRVLPPERRSRDRPDAHLVAVRPQPGESSRRLRRQTEIADVDHGVAVEAAARPLRGADGVEKPFAHVLLLREHEAGAGRKARRRPESVGHETEKARSRNGRQ